MASFTMFSGSKYSGFLAKDAPAECSMPWSTGRIDTYPVFPRRPPSRSCCRLRMTGTGRSEAACTRSTKSGPGRCSDSFVMPSQRCSSSARASAPRIWLMASIALPVPTTLAVLISCLLIHAGGEGAHLGRLLADLIVARDVARLLQVLLELARGERVAVEGRVQHPAVPHFLQRSRVHAQQQLHHVQRAEEIAGLGVDRLQVSEGAGEDRLAVARGEHRVVQLEAAAVDPVQPLRSEEHTSELQSRLHLVCR